MRRSQQTFIYKKNSQNRYTHPNPNPSKPIFSLIDLPIPILTIERYTRRRHRRQAAKIPPHESTSARPDPGAANLLDCSMEILKSRATVPSKAIQSLGTETISAPPPKVKRKQSVKRRPSVSQHAHTYTISISPTPLQLHNMGVVGTSLANVAWPDGEKPGG
jgi:hypothetical protein